MKKSAAEEQESAEHETGFVRGATVTLIGRVVGGGLSFVNEIVLARLLGAGTYGQFALASVLMRIGFGVSLFGANATVVHYVALHRSQGQTGRVNGTIIAALLLPPILGLTCSCVLMLLADWLASDIFGKPDAAPYIQRLAAAIPFLVVAEILALVTRGFGFSRYYVLISNLIPPVLLLAGLTTILWLDVPKIWVANAIVAGYAIAAVVAVVCVIKVAGPDLWRHKPIFAVREFYDYSLPVLKVTMFYLIIDWADILLVSFFVSDEGVGIYRACMQIVSIFDMILIPVNAAASNIFPVLKDDHQVAARNRVFRLVTLVSFGLSVPLFLLIALHARAILLMLGDGFATGATLLVILAAGRLIRSGLGSSAFALVMSGRQRAELKNAATGAASSILLNLGLIPVFGIFGAGTATAMTEVVINTLRVRQVRRQLGVRIPWDLLFRIAAVAGFAAIAVILLEQWATIDAAASSAALLISMGLAAVVFFAALLFFGVSRQDRALLIGAIAQRSMR